METRDDTRAVAEALHPLEIRLLAALETGRAKGEGAVRQAAGMPEDDFRRAREWLLTKGLIRVEAERTQRTARLTETGERFAREGLPEERMIRALRERGTIPMREMAALSGFAPDELGPAIGALRKIGAMVVDAGAARLGEGADLSDIEAVGGLVRGAGDGIPWDALPEADRPRVEALVHKRLRSKGVFWIEESVERDLVLTAEGLAARDAAAGLGRTADEISRLTPGMLGDGSWRGRTFRRYAIDLAPPRMVLGRKHPYRLFLDFVKYKLTTMGFEEMRGPLAETEFWNNDALYMPQFHAARDIHDAYFVRAPTHAKGEDARWIEPVARMHESGGDAGSRGWRYAFDRRRTMRLLLRSQGTALSARTLGADPKVPGKYFAIARCFRYDTVDATHASDFFQVEGIMLGAEIDFRVLLGLLKLFAIEVAKAEEMRFAPAYFPFTEPSVEVHIRHPRLGWVELGGAGIFREEVTRPFGIRVPVIAWGLGLDRMAMVALRIDDIRELFSTDLDSIRARRIEMELA
ncbi:MAG: phenylalanine--tRNA ligase subunit alpha [Planctomycetes bacterium]|nr:phenylalanine--tRNA ligase subunit alpha [Planctomycetota bacterium]